MVWWNEIKCLTLHHQNKTRMEKHQYNVGFVFFAYTEDTKDEIESALNKIGIVKITDVYCDSDNDWNIECEVVLTINTNKNTIVFDNVEKELHNLLQNVPYETWVYRYIRGLDNDYYWQTNKMA